MTSRLRVSPALGMDLMCLSVCCNGRLVQVSRARQKLTAELGTEQYSPESLPSSVPPTGLQIQYNRNLQIRISGFTPAGQCQLWWNRGMIGTGSGPAGTSARRQGEGGPTRVLSWHGHFFDLLLSETMRPSRIVESAAGSSCEFDPRGGLVFWIFAVLRLLLSSLRQTGNVTQGEGSLIPSLAASSSDSMVAPWLVGAITAMYRVWSGFKRFYPLSVTVSGGAARIPPPHPNVLSLLFSHSLHMLSPTRTSVPSVEDAFLNADTKVAINGPSVEMSLDTWKATPQAYDMSTFLEGATPRDAVGLALSMWEQLHDVLSLLAMHALRSSPTCVTRKRQNMVDFVAEERCHRWAGFDPGNKHGLLVQIKRGDEKEE
ncbi:hypothetical protein BJV77DRAFT_963849 [Russula vinacea]|nr:hypothetical protein BJV77DRAFT_963849 [Russula vinacea]